MPQMNTMAASHEALSRSGSRHGLLLFGLLSCSFISTLDFFIVAVAIPSIRLQLNATESQLEWVVAGYGLAFAAMLVAAGRLGEHVGRLPVLRMGVIAFGLTSVACGLAPSANVLVAARVLQGISAAAMAPQVLAVINLVYKDTNRTWAFAWLGIALGLAATLGQLIGGALIESDIGHMGWRWCFLINPALIVAPLALLHRAKVPETPAAGGRLDITGIILLAGFLTTLAIPLVEGRRLAWPHWLWTWHIAAAAFLALLAWQQTRAERNNLNPLFRPGLLQHRSFRQVMLAAFIFYAGNASLYFVIGIYLQAGRGLSPLMSGVVFGALTAGFFAGSLLAPKIVKRKGFIVVPAGAAVVFLAYLAQLAFGIWSAAYTAWLPLVLCFVLGGLGIGLLMTPLTSLALADVPAEYLGVAAGTFATTQWIGNSLGVALICIPFFGVLDRGGEHAYQAALNAAMEYLLAVTAIFFVLIRRVLRGK
jgi:MFS family permease